VEPPRPRAGINPTPTVLSLLALLPLVGCGAKAPPRPRPEAGPTSVRPAARAAPARPVAPSVSGYGRERALALSWRYTRARQDPQPRFQVQRRPFDRSRPYKTVQTVDLGAPAGARLEGDSVEILDFDLVPGERYEYRVIPLGPDGRPGPASKNLRVEWREPPAPPSRLKARPGDSVVELGWDASPDADVEGYNVYRAEAGEDPGTRPLNTRAVAGLNYVDLGPANNQEFHYTVRALVRAGDLLLEGPPSPAASAVPRDLDPPPPPAGVAVAVTDRGIRISWEPVVTDDLAGYRIYRRAAGVSDYEQLTDKPIRDTAYVDRKADTKKSWSYVVTAVDTAPSHNESGHSREVTLGAADDL